MAIFGRNTARQRLRRAARESLKVPAFSAPVDCTPWVTGGLWPAELSTMTTETAPLVKYLKADLQKIVNSANEELLGIRRAGLADPIRQAEEARVINAARTFAVRRVESSVRHLRNMASKLPAAHRPTKPVNGADDTEKTQQFTAVVVAPTETKHVDRPAPAPQHVAESDDTEVLDEVATAPQEVATGAEAPVDDAPSQPAAPRHAAPPPTPVDDPVSTNQQQVDAESERDRLKRLLKFVARQEPGLRWAIGNQDDKTTLLVTDLAHGWIPPGIMLPADVRLLAPERRRAGNAAALLPTTTLSASYAPSDPLGWAADDDVTNTSTQPRALPPVDDLGWLLSEATHWRDGLPRMVHTLAKAGAGGTGVIDAEIDILRVYLDTARYQLFAQYPDIDTGMLLNCLLLAATEGIATGDLVSANYHFAWFQTLSAPPDSGW